MLHMEIKKKILFIIYFFISSLLYAVEQTVEVDLQLTYPGASAQEIGNSFVIDLGFLKEGSSYSRLKIGTVNVKISQRMSDDGSDPCVPESIEFNSINLEKLRDYREKIDTTDTIYIGAPPGIILNAEVTSVIPQGSISPGQHEYYFVAPECIIPNIPPIFEGVAITKLQYSFDLYATIGMVSHGVRAAKAENKQHVQLSIRDLISNQIKGSAVGSYRRRNR